jgi:cytochrome oxidase assembly protein ShyY1
MRRAALTWALPALLACVGFAALGNWQLQRAAWKERLLAAWAAAAVSTAGDYAALVGARSGLPRREDLAAGDMQAALPLRVEVRGQWDPTVTLLLDNQRLGDVVGAMVFSRFVPQGAATPLLVNRGWIALGAGRTPPAVPLPGEGPTMLRGLLVAWPASGVHLGPAPWQRGQPPALLTWLDLDALRRDAGALFDGVLQLDADQTGGFTRQWQALPNTLPPERHRGYAVQWFGLAALVALCYFLLAVRRRP